MPTFVRVNQEINGRSYHIEVVQVSPGRWRAQVVTAYGGRTALMPFYDDSPEKATHRLAAWLTRAHECAMRHL